MSSSTTHVGHLLRATLAALTLLGMISLVGCASNSSPRGADGESGAPTSAGTTFYDFQGMLAEYRAEAGTLPLPEGVSWIEPVDPGEELLPDGTRGAPSYEKGYGLGTAGNQWFCFWTREWLAQRGVDAAAEVEALAKMNSYVTVQSFVENADPESLQPYIIDLLAKATLGDPSVAATYDTINCTNWLATPSPPEAVS